MPRNVSRRRFIGQAAALSALAVLPVGRLAAQVRFSGYPFKLGVSSGDPTPDGFVIWTRLLPEPHDPGELGKTLFEVDWDVAEDPGFTRVVTTGRSYAPAHLGHSVHAEVAGLAPGNEYFYRFRIGRYESPTGRALTTPATTESPSALRMALTSCAQYEQGFFAAYRYMADDRPDLIVELGDYIYEVGYGERRVRLGQMKDAETLDDYRRRYAQYQLDPDLQAAHMACPWLVTWDDHDVANDYAGLTSEHEACGGEEARHRFRSRRQAAYQAWFEHMPVRPSRLRAGGGIEVFGSADWGRLARFHLLDTRQHRSVQACPRPATPATCDTLRGRRLLHIGAGGARMIPYTEPGCREEVEDPSRTMLGDEQERWLEASLGSSRAAWNFLAQGTPFSPIYEGSAEAPLLYSDGWPGYPVARQRLLDALRRHQVVNPVMLAGDPHAFFVNEVRDARGETVATELITTAACNYNTDKSQVLHLNPHIRYHDGKHCGYMRCEVSPDRVRTEMVAIEDMRDPRTPRQVLATWDVLNGDPRPRPVTG